MKKINLGSSQIEVPLIAIGCMRLNALSQKEVEKYVLSCMEAGAAFFDHADAAITEIYETANPCQSAAV